MKISSIIFDLGNVLINWKPGEFLKNNGYPESLRVMILNDIFISKEWQMLDNGDITCEEAVKMIAGKSLLTENQIRAVFNSRLKIISPITCNTNLLPELKKMGYKLYYLSNFPDDIFDTVRSQYGFFNYFDGGEISARLKASKPDKKIFSLLLSKYTLNPDECLFIDDSDINASSAEECGMKVIHLLKPELLKLQLEEKLDIKLPVV
ncbi:MAG: HAD-IA family hydrolase [Bacteroidales bacterium]